MPNKQSGLEYWIFYLKPVKKEELASALTKAKSLLTVLSSSLLFDPELTGRFEELIQGIQLLDRDKAENEILRLWKFLTKGHHFPWYFKIQLAVTMFNYC